MTIDHDEALRLHGRRQKTGEAGRLRANDDLIFTSHLLSQAISPSVPAQS